MWNGWSKDEGGVLKPPSDEHKWEQKNFYDQDALCYETQMLRLPFWDAQTSIYLQTIRSFASGCDVMLEVGGGTGRISLPLHDSFKTDPRVLIYRKAWFALPWKSVINLQVPAMSTISLRMRKIFR